eukprot:TRINITY_DN9853_c0_g1_i2.p1 TRINITY_DN9853_c0_g1~~TRINITY_DN9853_c0_g1_i2.p1  ORF type:complete len:428 (-),score=119.74 TRINITY_DN9853_c0_g1_i2:539-1822(-)
MSAKACFEYDAKRLVSAYLREHHGIDICRQMAPVGGVGTADLAAVHPWLLTERLVVKPDQLIKRRGKLGLVKLNMDLESALKQCREWSEVTTTIGKASGKLERFLLEPMVPHTSSDEHYVCIMGTDAGADVLFCADGGVDVGDVDATAARVAVAVGDTLTPEAADTLVSSLGPAGDPKRVAVAAFVAALFAAYDALHFTYLEINPLVASPDGASLAVLDMAARLDSTADFLCHALWNPEAYPSAFGCDTLVTSKRGKGLEFPSPFGRGDTPEEAYIAALDAKTGASLKLTVLNPHGRVWTMVAGGGASVVYSDTIADLGFAGELANYGEYSGAPNDAQTYEYAKTILDLMTRTSHPDGKVLIIGGGIANFTNVAKTFQGIVKALREVRAKLLEVGVRVFVRRGGPNYQEGLRNMSAVGEELGIPIFV